MRHVSVVPVLLVLALVEPLEAQRRPVPPGHLLTLVVTDVSDRPCTGLEVPASGVTVDVSAPRIDEIAVTGRDGRATFRLPTGYYDLAFSKGTWSETVEDFPVTMDRTAAVAIPQRTEASAWDLHVGVEAESRFREGDRFPVTVRVRWIDPDEDHFVPEGTVVLERSSRSSLRGRRPVVDTVATWSVGPLCGSSSEQFDYEETDLSPGSYTYRPHLETPDRNPRNDTARAVVLVTPPAQPDLALSVEQSHATIPPGETVTYSVRVANQGTGLASGVDVRIHVSENLDFVSADGSHGLACSPGATNALGRVILCSGGQVEARQTAEIEIRASLPETAQPGHTIQFVSRADPDDAIDESDEGNNHEVVQATSGSPPPADLAVSVEQSREILPAGKSIRYNVSIANVGETRASGVYVRNRISQNLDFVYAHGSEGLTCSPGGTNAAGLAVECTGGVVEPGQSALIEIVGELSATANPGHELRFVAWADPDDAIDESDEGNNHRTVLATTGDPVLVEHLVDGDTFVLAAREAGWRFTTTNNSLLSAAVSCGLSESGSAAVTIVAPPLQLLPGGGHCTFEWFVSDGRSRRLAPPWTVVSFDISIDPNADMYEEGEHVPTEIEWISPPGEETNDPYFAMRGSTSDTHSISYTFARVRQVVLRGPEGHDWRDALE